MLVTNTCDFVLLGEDAAGRPAKLETFRLAELLEEFESNLETPRVFAREVGAGLGEYLFRALSHPARLVEPADLARLLASYARTGLTRVEMAATRHHSGRWVRHWRKRWGCTSTMIAGWRSSARRLYRRSSYGVFSAWVLWARNAPSPAGAFDWRTAVWHLRVPVLRALFQQLSDPGPLRPLGLVEVLDWTAAALDRVDRSAFFARFNEGEAVQYFYEPFLEAFDPFLRKNLGVWYTPIEVVRYMVARVDRALKDDLDIPDGLAAENVYVLDPCCGTGAYLARGTSTDRSQPRRPRPGCVDRCFGEGGGDEACFRLRDHACAFRRGPSAGRSHLAEAGRVPVGGEGGTPCWTVSKRFGRSASKRRSTRSAGRAAESSGMVVRLFSPLTTPFRPWRRMRRSTVHRATPTPSRCNWRHTLRAPYTPKFVSQTRQIWTLSSLSRRDRADRRSGSRSRRLCS